MRKIRTQNEIESKEKRNKTIIGVVLVGIMLLSTLGYAFFSGDSEVTTKKIEYNGVTFIQSESGYWQFEANGYKFYTQYTPEETQNLSAEVLLSPGDLLGKTLFFLGTGNAISEIEMNLRNLASKTQDGCLKEYEDRCSKDSPIKSCESDNMIIVTEGNETKITQDKNCIFISAPYSQQVLAADMLIFKILGVA